MSTELPTGLDLGGVELSQERRCTAKTVLARGHLHHRPAIVKVLRSGEEFWQATFEHEIGIYRAFQVFPPPVQVPQMLHTDGHRVLVLQHLPGRPVATDRYPKQPLSEAALTQVLETVEAFALWAPPGGLLAPVFDYSERIARYHAAGWFDDADRAVLEQLAADVDPTTTPQHGDPLLSNLLLSNTGCALLDFEFTGLYAPGWDVALLHTLLAHVPGAPARIAAHLPTGCTETSWLLNRAVVLARERRLHHDLDPNTLGRRAQLDALHRQWHLLHHELHAK